MPNYHQNITINKKSVNTRAPLYNELIKDKTLFYLLQKKGLGLLKYEVKLELQKIAKKIKKDIQNNQLSGQTLNRVSGGLYKSIYTEVNDKAKKLSINIKSSSKYGYAHNDGYKNSTTIRAHLQNRKEVFGKPTKPYIKAVSSHTRNMNIIAKDFIGKELMKNDRLILERITKVVMGRKR